MARKPSSGGKTSSGNQTLSGNKTSLADQAASLEAMFDEARKTDSRMITVRGAREHNLKNVDLAIPRDKLVVFTGLSGSGKILARLRYDLCRRPAPLCRVALGLCPPVPRDDAASPMSTRSTGSPPPSRSSRRRPRRTRARPSAPSPRSTTICACSGRAPASPIRPRPACRSRARPCSRWSTGWSSCRRRRAAICSRRWCAAARASSARKWPTG